VLLVTLIFIASQLTSQGALTTVAGASLIVVMVGFAAQRFLTDVLTGALMLFEGWFSVGDTVTVEPWKLEGVVEEVALRATTIRSAAGETLRVHNSQVIAVRVVPRGVRELTIELFCTEEEQGRELIDQAARIMPVGPVQMLRAPRLVGADTLGDRLVRVRAQAATAPGSEWLVRDFLPGVIKELAPDGLIVHGPLIMETNAVAASRYARALSALR
jgi:small conductance mechanosensitive channel